FLFLSPCPNASGRRRRLTEAPGRSNRAECGRARIMRSSGVAPGGARLQAALQAGSARGSAITTLGRRPAGLFAAPLLAGRARGICRHACWKPERLFWWVSDRAGSRHRDPETGPCVRPVIPHCAMLGAAVVPERHRVRPPAEAALEQRVLRMRVQIVQDGETLVAWNTQNPASEAAVHIERLLPR